MEPKIVCLDEVTSSLDPAATEGIYQIINKLRAEGRVLLVSTHDLNFVADFADEAIYLENGVVKTKGAPANILAEESDPLFAMFYKRRCRSKI